jgi:hypothetical protein
MRIEAADAVESIQSATAECIVGEGSSATESGSASEPMSSQVCMPETATAKMAADETATAEMATGKMSPAEVPTGEVPAKMHAPEMAASKSPKMAKAAKVAEPAKVSAAKAAEMTKSAKVAEPSKVAAAKVAAAESTVPSMSFAHHPRHTSRRERRRKAEPEHDRRCESFRHPTGHSAFLHAPADLSSLFALQAWLESLKTKRNRLICSRDDTHARSVVLRRH